MTNLYLGEQFTNDENKATTDLEYLVGVKKELLDTFEKGLIENSPLYGIKNGFVVKLDEGTMIEDICHIDEEHY